MTATAPADLGAAPGRAPSPTGPDVRLAAVRAAATRPVSSASIEVVRIVYGLIGVAVAGRFLLRGWVGALHLGPRHHLTYPGFDWVAPLPDPWAHVHLLVLVAAGAGIAAGWRTRACLVVFLVGFAWFEMIDAALYLNHYWLVTLIGLLLVVLPIGRRWSLDARHRPDRRATTVPAAALWAVRAQIGVVYLAAGLAKLNADWLLRGEPLSMWLAARPDRPLVGPLLGADGVGMAAAWLGAAFDLTIVGWLLWRRSRPLAYLVLVAFHLATAALFQIGLFPWMMIALAPVFFAPDWPERLLRRLGRHPLPRPPTTSASTVRLGRGAGIVLGALVILNVVVPLRHLAYPGDVRRTDEGYYGSLRVMLTEKTGVVTYRLTDPATGERWTVIPEDVFEAWQVAELASPATSS